MLYADERTHLRVYNVRLLHVLSVQFLFSHVEQIETLIFQRLRIIPSAPIYYYSLVRLPPWPVIITPTPLTETSGCLYTNNNTT